MTELEALLILNAVNGIGNIGIKKALKYYGTALRIVSLNRKELEASKIFTQKAVDELLNFQKDRFLKEEFEIISREKIDIITFFDNKFPVPLAEIPDSPVVLYVNSIKGWANSNLSMAIVGSRRASMYGISIAMNFASRLAGLGINIVSGMARGIDSSAHRGALMTDGRTTAVLGCGLSHIYPPENRRLFEEIVSYGAVISEFPMKTPPFAYNFPRRNRIISGLSLGVIVVEAAVRSGALITADFALEQGREVFAVPGKVDNPYAKGTNNLIQQGAKLVTCIEDILDELKPQLKLHIKKESNPKDKVFEEGERKECSFINDLTNQEQKVYTCLPSQVGIHIDMLVDKCGLPLPLVSSILLRLEIKGIVKQLPGKIFVRRGNR